MTQQSLDHGGFIGEERVPVRASRATHYECPVCRGVLYPVDESETGASFVCYGGHGYLFYVAWAIDGKPRWVRADAVYERIAAEARAASGDGPALVHSEYDREVA